MFVKISIRNIYSEISIQSSAVLTNTGYKEFSSIAKHFPGPNDFPVYYRTKSYGYNKHASNFKYIYLIVQKLLHNDIKQ